MKRILINASQQEELRVAIVNGQKLIDLDIEVPSLQQKKGNIYKGSIARIEPSLNAAFVDYGGTRHGFLPFKEIDKSYYRQNSHTASGPNHQSLKEGQQVLIQVEREERGTKGAALTTYISLAGRYLVLMPDNMRATGISRRIQGQKREEAKMVLKQVALQKDEGLIVRTAGIGRDKKDLQWDLDYLRKLWIEITKAAKDKAPPFLVYQESDIVIRSMRDHFKSDVNEVIIDNQENYNSAKKFVKMIMPTYVNRLHLYDGSVPIFSHYQIEEKIETAYKHEVSLASGGALVFDHTEALLSVDINSGKATRGRDIEETALAINLEACEEIALQLRLRDVGGLIVIDFIDMLANANQRKVENALADATIQDRAKVRIGRISRFGLLEMSRQRLRPSLEDVSYIMCPRCNGSGNIRTLKSSAVAVLRMMEHEAGKEKTGRVVAYLPLDVTSYLLNEKRKVINDVSDSYNVQITIVPDIRMETPHFQISRYRMDDKEAKKKASYEFHTSREHLYRNNIMRQAEKKISRHEKAAAVISIAPDKPAPTASLLKKFFRSMFTSKSPVKQETGQKLPPGNNRPRKRRSSIQHQNDRRKSGEYVNRQRQTRVSDDRRTRQSQRRSQQQAVQEKAVQKPVSADQPPTEKIPPTKYLAEQYSMPKHNTSETVPSSMQNSNKYATKLSRPAGLKQVETKQRQ